MPESIDLAIAPHEIIVRGIVYPFFYSNSKKRLDKQAFLPPKGKNEVSTYRNRYANDHICKNSATTLQLGTNKYCGLAIFLAEHISHLNEATELEMKAQMISTPLDKNNQHIKDRIATANEEGKPFHADLVYDFIVMEGQPNTPIRKYAEALTKIAQYYHDPYPDQPNWRGEKLEWKS